MSKTILKSIVTVFLASTFVCVIVLAGSLNPSGVPVSSFKTLEDIYVRITEGTAAGVHNIYPSGPTAASMHTLDQIYFALPTNDKILYGTNSGTANTPPGSGTEATAAEVITGYYAFDGDGAVVAGSATAAPATLTWQTGEGSALCYDGSYPESCTLGNGLFDPNGEGGFGLWSQETLYSVGSEATDGEGSTYWYCVVEHTSGVGTFADDRAAHPTYWVQVTLAGASFYCSYLNQNEVGFNCTLGVCTPVDYWRLPTGIELAKAMVDSFFPNGTGIPGFGAGTYRAGDDANYVYSYGGGNLTATNIGFGAQAGVRCVH